MLNEKSILVETKCFKHPIPVSINYQDNFNETNDIVVFVQGLNGTIGACKLYNNIPFFNDKYLISYDKMAHGNNKNKACNHTNKYILELKIVIDYIKNIYPKNRIYLMGESAGAAISFLFMQKYSNLVTKCIGYNIPNKIIDVAKYGFFMKTYLGIKMLPVILFGITTYNNYAHNPIDFLTKNPIVLRIRKLLFAKRENNKNSWTHYRLCYRAWKTMHKTLKNNNIIYIQTTDDALCHINRFKKYIKKHKFSNIIETNGDHILSLDTKNSNLFYNIFSRFINGKTS